MRKGTHRKPRCDGCHPVAVALLNRQPAADLIVPRIAEHEALTAYQEGSADCDDHGRSNIAAHAGLHLCERGAEPDSRPIFKGAVELLDRLDGSSVATPTELHLLRLMVAAHDRQREQIGRGDYLKALKALQPQCRD